MFRTRSAKALVTLAVAGALVGVSAACSTPTVPPPAALTYCAPLAKLIALGPVDHRVGKTLTADQTRYANQAMLVVQAASADGREDVAARFSLVNMWLRVPADSAVTWGSQAAAEATLVTGIASTTRADCSLAETAVGH